MSFLNTIAEGEAQGLVKEQYDAALKGNGYVPGYVKAFSLRPEVYEAWGKLIGAIRGNMRLRRYELVTFASAMALECTYCLVAHAMVLRNNFFSPEEIMAIVKDYRNADLAPDEVAVMSLAQKIIRKAHQVSEADFEELRGLGLSDAEIFDVVLACTARSFFSKTLDATGAVPDEAYQELGPELLALLSKGREFPVR